MMSASPAWRGGMPKAAWCEKESVMSARCKGGTRPCMTLSLSFHTHREAAVQHVLSRVSAVQHVPRGIRENRSCRDLQTMETLRRDHKRMCMLIMHDLLQSSRLTLMTSSRSDMCRFCMGGARAYCSPDAAISASTCPSASPKRCQHLAHAGQRQSPQPLSGLPSRHLQR